MLISVSAMPTFCCLRIISIKDSHDVLDEKFASGEVSDRYGHWIFVSNLSSTFGKTFDQNSHSIIGFPHEQFQFQRSPGPCLKICPLSIANSPTEITSSDLERIFSSSVE